MSMEQIVAAVREFPAALVLAPEPGGDFPELAWGDAFFYYAPDGRLPQTTQPYGTVVTKNLPGDTESDLDPPGRWRVNIHVGRPALSGLTGEEPHDHAVTDTVLPHPVYGAQGWVCVVNPGPRTTDTVLRLLRGAHDDACVRFARRHDRGGGG